MESKETSAKQNDTKGTETNDEDDDPLDAFMQDIDVQVQKQSQENPEKKVWAVSSPHAVGK
jgi:hypothetical protein